MEIRHVLKRNNPVVDFRFSKNTRGSGPKLIIAGNPEERFPAIMHA